MADKEISVKEVRKNEAGEKISVIMRVLGVEFVFGKFGNKIEIIFKSKPEAQIHDPCACEVPVYMFNKARRQAAAILLSKK